MGGDWFEQSRLMKTIKIRYCAPRFVWGFCYVDTDKWVCKEENGVDIARSVFRKRKEGCINLVSVCSKPYRCHIDPRGVSMKLARRDRRIATGVLDGVNNRIIESPPWGERFPNFLLGVIYGPDQERYWVCARNGWYATDVLAGEDGVALFGRTTGGKLLMRDDFDWRANDWLLALWLSYDAYKKGEWDE